MNGVMLQWIGGFGGFSFTDLLNDLENMGFFAYILPFLLIFALVYAILSNIKIFTENKGATAIVALASGLLALQFDKVPAFFQIIFPNLGIALSVLLAALILAGAFIGDAKGDTFKWILFGLGGLTFLIVVMSSFSEWSFFGTGWWDSYGGILLFLLIIGGVIVAVVATGKKNP